MNKPTNIKQSVKCSQCGANLVRIVWNYGQNRMMTEFFCDNICKAKWQRAQREALGYTKEWLIEQYITLGKNANQIAAEIGRDGKGVWQWIHDYGIKTRHRGGSTSPGCFQKGQVGTFTGKKHSVETKKKLSDIAKADGRVPFDPKIGPPMRGKRGADTVNWKGGITPERQCLYSSEEWSKTVVEIWKRDNAICQRCGKRHNTAKSRGTFHIHHIVSFEVKSLRTAIDNLILLCRTCHFWVHSKENKDMEFIRGHK